MQRPILIIKTGNTIASLQSQGEDFEHWFCEGLGLGGSVDVESNPVLVCNAHEGETLPPLDSIGGLIITGSPAYLTDLAPWNYVVADYVRAAHAAKIPQLGICYGHQLIAWAFGGEVGFHPRGREIGSVAVHFTEAASTDPLFQGLPGSIYAQASHLQSVLKLPDEAVLLGANEFEPHHCFRMGEFTWCAQFHPEFNAAITKAYISERAKDIAAEGLDPDGLRTQVRDTPESASLLRRFMEIVREKTAASAA